MINVAPRTSLLRLAATKKVIHISDYAQDEPNAWPVKLGGARMEFAQSAPMALRRIADAGDRSLILILSDINMPGMSGLELLPKAEALRPDVPIIMITAYGDAETKRKALENGAETLVTKPIDFGMLRSEIDKRVERGA